MTTLQKVHIQRVKSERITDKYLSQAEGIVIVATITIGIVTIAQM